MFRSCCEFPFFNGHTLWAIANNKKLQIWHRQSRRAVQGVLGLSLAKADPSAEGNERDQAKTTGEGSVVLIADGTDLRSFVSAGGFQAFTGSQEVVPLPTPTCTLAKDD